MSLTPRIIELSDGSISAAVIARTLGCSRQLVNQVQKAKNLPRFTRNKVKMTVYVSVKMARWLHSQRSPGVGLSLLVCAIITDAMEEENGQS